MENNKTKTIKAFPNVTSAVIHEKGMDLRDYFANSAMQAILSNHELFLKVLES